MKHPITPNQVNLELFAALSYIMNKGEIQKADTVKEDKEDRDSESRDEENRDSAKENGHFLQPASCHKSSTSSF